MNNARQLVARLEAMIDVEKHLSELEKIRSERNGGGSSTPAAAKALAGALPASALTPPPASMNSAAFAAAAELAAQRAAEKEKEKEKEKAKSILTGLEVARIVGSEGRYSAVLKLGNGELKPVHVGDQISEHSTVRWISSSSVLIEDSGSTHAFHIKNVDMIYSAMR